MTIFPRSLCVLFALVGVEAASAATANIIVLKPETCGNSNGEMYAYMSGSGDVPPYTYLWSNGATTETITGLPGGSYSVTITDAMGTLYTANSTVESFPALPFEGTTQYGPSATSFFDITGFTGLPCPGQCNGILSLPQVSLGGTPPFSASFDVAVTPLGVDNYGFLYYSGFCDGATVNYTITDAQGCQGSSYFTVNPVQLDALPSASDMQGACAGSDIGSFNLYPAWAPTLYSISNGGGYIVQDTVLYEFDVHSYGPLAAGIYTMDAYPMLGQCPASTTIEVPDLGAGCTQLEGNAWYDQDADCVWGAGEVGVPGSVMVIQPGTQYAITGGNGHYRFNLAAGNYTIAQTNPTLEPYCPATQPVPFTVNGPIANIDFANNSTAPLDLRAHINGGWARPGFTHSINGSSINSTAQLTGAVEVVITIDPTVDLVSVTPTPTTSAGNVFTWQIAELDYFGSQGFNIQTTVPVNTPLGTVLNHSISVSSANTDADLSDNTDLATEVVFGSFDPNDKKALTSSRQSEALYFINEDEWIDYTIRFQNTGTAEALFVTVTDTLPEELDMTSFQMAVASHDHVVSFKPGRVVEWFFDDINLPDSTSDEAGSHGFVKFRIKPLSPLLVGTVIENSANIYFDFNEPVITEPSLLVAEFSTGVSQEPEVTLGLSPVPVREKLLLSCKIPIASIVIVGVDGREVFHRNLNGSTMELDVADLTAGTYVLLATLTDGTVVRERFIKQ